MFTQTIKSFLYLTYRSITESLDIIFLMLMAGICGLLIYLSLKFVKQNWVNTYHHLTTYILLPIIALIITRLIANNIALSLGMIGALSIIRFRNPVKSPLELIIFFALLTIGIGLSVKPVLGIYLTLGTCLVLIILDKCDVFLKTKGHNLYSLSFDDGISNNLIDISSKNQLVELDKHKFLISYYFNKNEELYNYRLSSKKREDIDELKSKFASNTSIISIDVTYV